MCVMSKQMLCFYPRFQSTLNFWKIHFLRPNLPVAEPFPAAGIEASSFGNNSVYNIQTGQWTLITAAYEEFAKHPLPKTFD